jgi:hypothetical protein
MRKGLGGLGTLLVLGLGLGFLRNSPAPGAGAALSASPPTTTNKLLAQEILDNTLHPTARCPKPNCAAEDLLNTIDTFFSYQRKSAAGPSDTVKPLVQEFESLAKSGNDVTFAIALVPDPVHTHLSLFFDRAIDAIEQGAQEENWIFDRATMPWDNEQHPESTDLRIRLLQRDYQSDKENLPGLMIFRPLNQDEPNLNRSLFVFVVGETPTGGVSKEQFRNAVMLIGVVAKAETPLRIIGPTFSGSLYSVAQLLGNELPRGRFRNVVIRSGTVSSWDTTEWFKKWFEQQRYDGRLCVDFATFEQSDRYMLRKFVGFEKNKGYSPEGIAVLAEDETAYGNFVAPDVLSSEPPQQKGANSTSCPTEIFPDTRDGTTQLDETLLKDENSVVHLYFPRDISQLRSAYQRGFEKQVSTTSFSSTYEVHSVLPLDLRDTGSDDDSVSQYAHSQSPLSQEAILLGIATSLREHKIEFVLLQATNPMDKLFLSRFLRKAYPEGRVVTMDGDLLMRRDVEDDRLLHGVMSLGIYSLLPGADDNVAYPSALPKLPHADHVFPAAASVGIYNATVSQLSIPKPDFDCLLTNHDKVRKPTIPMGRYSEYGWPLLGGIRGDLTEPLTPVTWLTVLGRDGYWPLAVLDDGKSLQAGTVMSALRSIQSDKAGSEKGSSECPDYQFVDGACLPKFHRHSPLVWKLLCGIAVALVIGYLLLLWKSSIMASSSLMTQFAPVKDLRRAALIAVVGCLLLTVLLLLLWPWVHWPAMSFSWVAYLIEACLALLFVGCVVELLRRQFPLVAGAFTAIAAAIMAAFMVSYGSATDYTRDPFLYRYIHLTSGVSPLAPFLRIPTMWMVDSSAM